MSIQWNNQSTLKYQPDYKDQQNSDSELIFIYIGSSSCSYSNNHELPRKIDQLKRFVQSKAKAHQKGFIAQGISIDWKTENGLEHLSKFGKFDEISTGRSWINYTLLEYVWEKSFGEPATPQVIVIDRNLLTQSPENPIYIIGDEYLLAQKVGIDEISNWLDLQAPLPKLSVIEEK